MPDVVAGEAAPRRGSPGRRPGTIRQGDRDKALRPLSLEDRRAAFEDIVWALVNAKEFQFND